MAMHGGQNDNNFLKVRERGGGELHKKMNVLSATELDSYKWFMYFTSN